MHGYITLHSLLEAYRQSHLLTALGQKHFCILVVHVHVATIPYMVKFNKCKSGVLLLLLPISFPSRTYTFHSISEIKELYLCSLKELCSLEIEISHIVYVNTYKEKISTTEINQ